MAMNRDREAFLLFGARVESEPGCDRPCPDSAYIASTYRAAIRSYSQESREDTPKIAESKQGSSCCDGTACGCDDSCLDQLARAICADDDGHIHDEVKDDNIDKNIETCKCEDTEVNSVAEDGRDVPIASTISSTASVDGDLHSCGLRKRKNIAKPEGLPQVACGEHKSLALSRQRETLALFGCVCKALLARGLESCCVTQSTNKHSHSSSSSRASLLKKDNRRGSCDSERSHHSDGSKSSHSHVSLRIESRNASTGSVDSCCGDSCCAGNRSIRSVQHENDTRSRKSASRQSLDSCCGNSCCGNGGSEVRSSRDVEVQSCCNGGDCCGNRPTSPSVCGNSCCDKESLQEQDIDIEKHTAGISSSIHSSSLNHTILAIKGMTCTGCENKLIRALQAIPTIHHIKTSLVLARAEFDYSGAEEDLRVLIGVIEKRTGFSAEEVVPISSHTLDLTVDPALLEKICLIARPDGVEEVVRINKNTVRISHDPHLIGARDIISAYATFSPKLAPVPKNAALAAGLKHLRYLAFRTVLSALLTIPVLVMTWAPLPDHAKAYSIASLILATIVQTAIAGPFYFSAFKSLFFSKVIETDLLIVLSTTTAYVYSVVAFTFDMLDRPLQSGEFFETSTLLVTLIMLGQLVSAFARHRAIEAISLRSLQQNTAILVHKEGMEEEIDARLLQFRDTFKVLPDSSIITDGIVTQGQSEADESMMTGEALPVFKQVGSTVVAGTSNGPSVLLIKVTRLPGDNTITDIAEMVDDARFSRAKVQEVVDVVCGWFVPIVLALTIVTFIVWIIVGVKVRSQSAGEAAVTAITYAIAVLAVSCPCAIGLAVPMVILIASGVAAKHGLVFKSATTIELARKIDHVVFDKTGTLTKGQLTVVESTLLNESETDVCSAILSLTSSSKHPVARAVAEKLQSEKFISSTEVGNVEVLVGKGIIGSWKGEAISGGNARWLGVEQDPHVQPFIAKGLTTFCVTYHGQLLAVFALSDALRPETPTVISKLLARGIEVSILSGDHPAAVNHIATELGISSENVRAGCLPVDKQAYIRELTKGGRKVLFCGDGTNDAIALAQADIGVHMHEETGSGAGIAASSAADVVLIRPSLSGILTLMELSKVVNRRIVLNFAWSAVYNLVAILFAAGAFVGARIAPAYAGLGEVVSVVPVVLVAIQLKWFKESD
ncbi:unnamed protein product [Somion occarium]|uniref:HMA domain-containing protein n=1 Tax=Somion occarium TaxID=3059160 RepID=A0ABP1E6X7_9APHY